MSDTRQDAENHYFAALDLYAEGKAEESIAEYRACLEKDPQYVDALHGLARVYQDLSRFDDAIEVAKKISEADPDDVLAHTSLSILYQKKGMIAEAEEESNRARILGWKQQLKQGKQ